MNIENLLTLQNNYNYFINCDKLYKISQEREVVFLCVGNPKLWYDSFGPMFGCLLRYLELDKFIYGNVNAPITAKNLEHYVESIYKFHTKPYIVVIDTALSKASEMTVKMNEGSIKCAILSDNPVDVGDMYISFCINNEAIKDPNNYYKMLSYIKQVARMLVYTFKNY